MNENGKTINHTNLMNFVLYYKRKGFLFLNRNSTGDLAQLTYFFLVYQKSKGGQHTQHTQPLIKYKKILQSIVTNPKFLYKQNC